MNKIETLAVAMKRIPKFLMKYRGTVQETPYLLCKKCRLLLSCDFTFCDVEDCRDGFEPIG